MRTTWRVKRVIDTEATTLAELVSVEWYQKNPAFDQMMEDYKAVEEAEGVDAADEQFADREEPEWLEDVQPGQEGAEYFETTGSLTIDITDGLALRAGDNVFLTLDPATDTPLVDELVGQIIRGPVDA